MKKKSLPKEEYSITGFADVVSSPIFYSVIILTIILGLASVFGFFQNPLRLKLIIDLISQRVSISKVENKTATEYPSNTENSKASLINDLYPDTYKKLKIIYQRDGKITASSLDDSRYSILKDIDEKNSSDEDASLNSMIPVSLDYNISSPHFWGKLSQKKPTENLLTDIQLSPYDSLQTGDSIYSLKVKQRI